MTRHRTAGVEVCIAKACKLASAGDTHWSPSEQDTLLASRTPDPPAAAKPGRLLFTRCARPGHACFHVYRGGLRSRRDAVRSPGACNRKTQGRTQTPAQKGAVYTVRGASGQTVSHYFTTLIAARKRSGSTRKNPSKKSRAVDSKNKIE